MLAASASLVWWNTPWTIIFYLSLLTAPIMRQCLLRYLFGVLAASASLMWWNMPWTNIFYFSLLTTPIMRGGLLRYLFSVLAASTSLRRWNMLWTLIFLLPLLTTAIMRECFLRCLFSVLATCNWLWGIAVLRHYSQAFDCQNFSSCTFREALFLFDAWSFCGEKKITWNK